MTEQPKKPATPMQHGNATPTPAPSTTTPVKADDKTSSDPAHKADKAK